MPKRLACFDGEMLVIARLMDARNALNDLEDGFNRYRAGQPQLSNGERGRPLKIVEEEDRGPLTGMESKMIELAHAIVLKAAELQRSPGRAAA